MLVYCDTNVYCRPLDDQSQPRIKSETGAFLSILERVEEDEITLVSSDILEAEVNRIPNPDKRRLVRLYVSRCGLYVSISLQIARSAEDLVRQCGLKAQDALHVASAFHGEVRFFLTCDDGVASKRDLVTRVTGQLGFEVQVLNPLEFVEGFE